MKKLAFIFSLLIALIGLNANAAMYIVGNNPFGNWHTYAGEEMTDNGNGVYTYVTDQISGTVWFVFADNLTTGTSDDWSTFNGSYRYGPLTSGQTVSPGVEYTTQKSTNGNVSYNFTGTAGEPYQFTFDTNTMKFKVEGYVEPVVFESFTVAGNNADIFGTTWAPAETANDMTLDETDGLYKLVRNGIAIPAAYSLEYKVVANHSWDNNWGKTPGGDNQDYYFEEAGTYNLTFKFDLANEEVTLDAVKVEDGPVVEDYYIVAGTENLFGSEWAANDSTNLMTAGENGIYTWTKVGYEATAGEEVEFKVVANGNWNTCWPASDENGDNNWYYQFAQEGTYDIVITFNPETKEINMTATKQGGEEPPVEDTYTVAGTENLFGSFWNPADEANDMVKGEDGIYTWTKNNVVFEAVDTIQFKVVKNHDWDAGSWPENNWWYQVASEGTYDFVITFNPETNEVTFNATKQGEEPTEMVYTVVGPTYIFGTNWDATDTNNDMVKGEDGIYTWSKEEVTLHDDFEFKVVGDHDYAIYEWPMGMDNNWHANVEEEGIYTIEITFNPEAEEADRITCTLTKTGDVEPIVHTYTVAGSENLCGSFWNPADEANDMVKGEDGIYTWTKDGVALEAEEVIEFKVVEDHSWDYAAWPSSNWYFKAEEAGNYNIVITFDPTADDMNKITFTATLVPSYTRGDVDMDGNVGISDVSAIIDYLLSHDPEGISVLAADTDVDGNVGISDVSALIDYLLSHEW